jgi:hypothetical protein
MLWASQPVIDSLSKTVFRTVYGAAEADEAREEVA